MGEKSTCKQNFFPFKMEKSRSIMRKDVQETRCVGNIKFGMLSASAIRKMSVVEIINPKINPDNTEGTIYDERMGCNEPHKLCLTCKRNHQECPGHFGHIELNLPVPHPLHMRHILCILRCVCFNCSRCVFTKGYAQVHFGYKADKRKMISPARFTKLSKLGEKMGVCGHCLKPQPKFSYQPNDASFYMAQKGSKEEKIILRPEELYQIFNNVLDEDVCLLGLDPTMVHPRDLILMALPVLPPVDRPCVNAEGITCDDDLSIQYIEILKTNLALANETTAQSKRTKCEQSLKFRVKCLFDNSQNKAKHTNGRPFKGIKRRVAGKDGQVRGNLMGKRVEQAARTVIGPDPTLRNSF